MIYLHRMTRPSRVFGVLVAAALFVTCAEEQEPNPRHYRQTPTIVSEPEPIEPLPADLAPSVLIGPFRSMMRLDEAIALTGDLPFEVKMNSRTEKRGICPGQHWLQLAVTRFWDLDHKGTLTLAFYDDLLTWARFLTADSAGYRSAFFASHQTEEPGLGVPAFILPGTAVQSIVIGNAGTFVEDFRLTQWIDEVEIACRYQWQKERGWTDDS